MVGFGFPLVYSEFFIAGTEWCQGSVQRQVWRILAQVEGVCTWQGWDEMSLMSLPPQTTPWFCKKGAATIVSLAHYRFIIFFCPWVRRGRCFDFHHPQRVILVLSRGMAWAGTILYLQMCGAPLQGGACVWNNSCALTQQPQYRWKLSAAL